LPADGKVEFMLNHLPRPVLVFFILAVGVLLFFVIQKPHSICQSQLDVLKESEAGKLFPGKAASDGNSQPPRYAAFLEDCRQGNGPGACFEYFNLLRNLIRDLNGSPRECLVPFGDVSEVKKALFDGAQIMALIAWGDHPPDRGTSRFNWFEAADISLFCGLKDMTRRIYGDEGWEQLRLSVQGKLPGAKSLSPEEIWVRSLFSVRCEQFR
jgi:hypothetical protein